jgi:RNA polymerase sigma factor (TIGR02999 family)
MARLALDRAPRLSKIDAANALYSIYPCRMAQFDDIYQQLKLIAKRELARRQRDTLNTTGLVHEAYIKLASDNSELDRAHRINLITRVMRQITVDHARAKQMQKRERVQQSLDHELLDTLSLQVQPDNFDLVAFDQALSQLAAEHPRMGRVLELSFFAGIDNEEIATLMDVNLRTVQRDLMAAKLLLQAQVAG